MLSSNANKIDAVIVSTPDHTHAPASIMAMKMDKNVYCQKPLTHHVSEARTMSQLAEEKNLVTQMGIQVHSFYDYKLATLLIQSGIIAMANPGEYILMPRNVHISVIKACALQNIIPIFFDLEFSKETGHYMPITKKWFTTVFNLSLIHI